MFQMLSCFNLKDDVSVQVFNAALSRFSIHMRDIGLIHSTGPIGERQSNTPMDTDVERDHRYFFVTTFEDRAQCDRAYAYIKSRPEPSDAAHHVVYSLVENPIFICWQEV